MFRKYLIIFALIGVFIIVTLIVRDTWTRKDLSPSEEQIRLQLLLGPKPSIERIHQVLGNPDDTYPGNASFKEELYFENVSNKIDVIIYILNDNSVHVICIKKER